MASDGLVVTVVALLSYDREFESRYGQECFIL